MNLKKRTKFFILLILGLLAVAIGAQTEILFTPVTYINASHINYTGFAATSGSLADIDEIDNIFWTGNEDGTPWQINVTFTNVTHFDFVEVKYMYFSTVGASTHINDIEIWCETDQQYINLVQFSNQHEQTYWTRAIPDSMHFIQPNGNVTVRFNHTENGNVNHRIWLDAVRLIVKPQFEQINATINTTGTGGAGCQGNCSFDGIWVNSIRKNDTLDSFGAFINLSAPFKSKSTVNPTYSYMDLNSGDSAEMLVQNTATLDSGSVFITPNLFTTIVGNGHSTTHQQDDFNITYLFNGNTKYIFNDSFMNYSGTDIIGLNETNHVLRINETRRNLFTNKIDSYRYANETEVSGVVNGDTNLLDHSLTSANLNSIHNIVGFLNVNTSGWNYFAARAANGRYYANNNTAYPENLTANKIMLRFSAAGWNGDGWSGSTGIIDAIADGTWNKTSTPTRIDLFTTGNSGSATKRMEFTKNGSLNFVTAGKGITLISPDGNDWCVTVTNAGALTVSSTPCN